MTRQSVDPGLFDALTGNLERPFPQERWRRPSSVELVTHEGQAVLVCEADPWVWTDVVIPGPKLVERFIDLADAPDTVVVQFASNWGVLNLCQHLAPHGHAHWFWPARYTPQGTNSYEGVSLDVEPCEGTFLKRRGRGARFEPVEAWRMWARRAQRLLDLAALIHQEQQAPAAQWWEALKPYNENPKLWLPGFPPVGLRASRAALAELLNWWLAIDRVGTYIVWEGSAPRLTHGGDGLFAAVALQLVLAATRTDALAICSGCGLTFLPTRRPGAARRCYCPSCGRRVAERDAARAYRARKARVLRATRGRALRGGRVAANSGRRSKARGRAGS